MEEGLSEHLNIAKDANLIKEAQADIGKIDIHICGECHDIFHFIEEFKSHKEGSSCTGNSSVVKVCEYEDKAQVWAFTLWKNRNLKLLTEDLKPLNSWVMYQKWCSLLPEEKNIWIVAGQTLQSLNKIRAAKIQEVKFKSVRKEEESDPLAITPSDYMNLDKSDSNDLIRKDFIKPVKLNDVTILPSKKDKRGYRTSKENDKQEHVVEKILAKRFNPRKKTWEYKIKWENFDESDFTWEPPAHLHSCKQLLEEFESNAKKEKLEKAKNLANTPKTQKKKDNITSNLIDGTPGRPQRSSKQKALNQVKVWCGNISDGEEGGIKRPFEDDDSDDSFEKKIKTEAENTEDDSEEEKPGKKPKTKIINNGTGTKLPENILIPDAQGIVRINQKQLPSLSSGVYIMSKTAGIIKLDSHTSKIAASGGQAIVKVAPKIGQTHIKIVKKDGGATNKIIQMSPRSIKTTPKPTYKVQQSKIVKKVEIKENKTPKVVPKEKETIATFFKEPEQEDSSDGVEDLEFPTEPLIPEPESPPGEFVLDPLTGKIAGIEYPPTPEPAPEPETQPEPEPQPETQAQDATTNQDPADADSMKANGESTLDNIVKLAAADITEEDLKTDPITVPTLVDSVNTGEDETPMEIVSDIKPVPKPVSTKISTPKPSPEKKISSSSILNKALSNSNILERTLQQNQPSKVRTPTFSHRVISKTYPSKSGQPPIRTFVRSYPSPVMKQQKPMIPKPRIVTMSPSGRIVENPPRQTYSKTTAARKIGNTTIYKRPSLSGTPRIPQARPVISTPTKSFTPQRRPQPQPPKTVISMPSLSADDDMVISQQPSVLTEAVTAAAVGDIVGEASEVSSLAIGDGESPVFITGDDGTVYQVAGQNEQGQTILITQGPDGQQQCLLVTSETVLDESTPKPEAVAEAAEPEEIMNDSIQEPLSIKTDPEPEAADQVVAQVVRAEPPSPGGTHKVVVMLPDGNLMVTQVTPEEYASLELDK